MSTGKLKAQYNRVRTSVALQSNSIWTKTIGVLQDPQAGSNAVIEASLKAPTHGGRGREARREAAKALIEEAGYEPAVTSFEGLVALARAQGSIGGTNRGACKVCGGLGHLTKQCKNHLSSFYSKGEGGSNAKGAEGGLPLVTEEDDISSLSSDVSSEGEDNSSISSLSDRERKSSHRKIREKKSSRRAGKRKRKASKKDRHAEEHDKKSRKKESHHKKSKKRSKRRRHSD